MIRRIATVGIVTGVGAIWFTGYLVEKTSKAITGAVNSAWAKTP